MNNIFSQARVVSNKKIADGREIYLMYLSVPDLRFSNSQAGQILMVECGGDTSLMRPFGVFDVQGHEVGFCYEVRGKGTTLLAKMRENDVVAINGPLGQGFSLPEKGKALLVGGGIGIFPLYYAAQSCECDAILGFRSKGYVNSVELFEEKCGRVHVCTDDGSFARKGMVTEPLSELLENGGYDSVHICGPIPMMRACAEIAKRYGVKAEVSMEERMGCGVGACYACVCKVLSADGFTYKRVCLEGPVFNASDIIF